MRRLKLLLALLAIAGGSSACTAYDPPGDPYVAHYCDSPPDRVYDSNAVVPHPMSCYQCGVCY